MYEWPDDVRRWVGSISIEGFCLTLSQWGKVHSGAKRSSVSKARVGIVWLLHEDVIVKGFRPQI